MATPTSIGIPLRVVACPNCPKCGTRMWLAFISLDKPHHDRRTYECPRCEHEVTETIKFI
jgi:hypothetical protein